MSEHETRPPERRRRLLRLGFPAVAALALYAAAGFLGVPRLVRWAVQTKGSKALERQVTLGEVRFNPFTMRGELQRLSVRDRDGQPLFSLARLRVRLGLSGLIRRAWQLRELAVDKPALQVRFLRDGKLSFADLFEDDDRESSPARVIIDQLSIRGGRLDYVDESSNPPFRATFAPLNADVHNLVTIPGRRGQHAISIGFDRESMLRMVGTQTLEPFGVAGTVEVSRLSLPNLFTRFSPDSRLFLRNGRADVHLTYDFRKEGSGVRFRVTQGKVSAKDVAVATRGTEEDLLNILEMEVEDASLAYPGRKADIGAIRLIAPHGSVAWNAGGRFNWAGDGTAPATTPAKQTAGTQPAAAAPWTLLVAGATIEGGALSYEDARTSPSVNFDLDKLNLSLGELTNDPFRPVAFTATSTAGSGALTMKGTFVPEPFSLDSRISLADVDTLPFRAYVANIPRLVLGSGSVDFDGRLAIGPKQPYLIEGDGVFKGVEFLDTANRKLLGCSKATLRKLRIDGSTSRHRIRTVDLDGLYANIIIDKDRNLNLSSIGAEDPAAPQPDAEESSGGFSIGTIEVRNSTFDYRDDSLVLPFSTAITSARGTVTDFSTVSRAGATIRLDGNVAEHGSMKATGTMRMSDPFAGTDLAVHFRSVPMPTLTPYVAEFAGYSIDRGDLDLDVRYRIVDRKLKGDNRVLAKDLTLGRKVSGTKAGFAVRLAVALLKDREGKINLEVPIEGTVDSPEFNYRAVLWQAVKTILGNAAKAPFRALGSALGIDSEELQVVAFDAGDATVTPPEAEKLRKIAAALAERPELALEIEGRFDSELDSDALKEAKFESLLAARRDVPQAGTDEPPPLETILQSLYAETFSPERLEEERTRFTSTPAPPPPPPRKFWQLKPAAPVAVPPVLDAKNFYDDLRAKLIAAQPVAAPDLRALGRSRASAIAAALTADGALAADRVRILTPAEARRKPGAQQISMEMKLSAKGAEGEEQ